MQHMEVEDEARTAIDALNGYNLNGQQMNVEVFVFSSNVSSMFFRFIAESVIISKDSVRKVEFLVFATLRKRLMHVLITRKLFYGTLYVTTYCFIRQRHCAMLLTTMSLRSALITVEYCIRQSVTVSNVIFCSYPPEKIYMAVAAPITLLLRRQVEGVGEEGNPP
jgi:hypothetical protein